MFDDSPGAIGERVAARRRARRLTQTALAAAAHVSYATVRSIERGARRRRRTGGDRRRPRCGTRAPANGVRRHGAARPPGAPRPVGGDRRVRPSPGPADSHP
ncbi:helix-turn-helix domain-containing protein [Streptomyces bacillaris]|uniref:helix-turn-helix domain-containing protein n=1 Tax=Streptomyces bacillaris TaxID=68179 RepID=UPI0034616D38